MKAEITRRRVTVASMVKKGVNIKGEREELLDPKVEDYVDSNLQGCSTDGMAKWVNSFELMSATCLT